jgi:hypothetical protein
LPITAASGCAKGTTGSRFFLLYGILYTDVGLSLSGIMVKIPKSSVVLYSLVKAGKFQAAWTPPVTIHLGQNNFCVKSAYIIFL